MTATNVTRKTLVVDGNNILVRAVFAMRHQALSADGVATGALHTFIWMLSKYVRQEEPDNLVVCWDGGRSEQRMALDPQYKGQRGERYEDEDPTRPFSQAKEFLTLAGIHHVEMLGVEADDVIAGYWRAKHSAERIVILSADKDFLQLLDGWTEQIRPGTGVDERWTANRVRTEFGCKPEHLPLVMALSGDASDNVPGIRGFGHKTAIKHLAKHGWDIDRLIAETDHVRLVGQGDAIRRNRALVDLRDPIVRIEVPGAPRFSPTGVTSVAFTMLDQFLTRYQLSQVRSHLVDGTLWGTPSSTAMAQESQ